MLAVILMIRHHLMGPVRQGYDDEAVDVMHVDAANVAFRKGVLKEGHVPQLSSPCIRPSLYMAESLFLPRHGS